VFCLWPTKELTAKSIVRAVLEKHSDEIHANPKFAKEFSPLEEELRETLPTVEVNASEQPKDEPLSLGTCIAATIAVFTIGSVVSVLGASKSFPFPFYAYFEPADYLRTAPIWGTIVASLLFSYLVVLPSRYLLSQKIATIPKGDVRVKRIKRFSIWSSILFAAVSISLFVWNQIYPGVYPASFLITSVFIFSDVLMYRLRLEPYFPRHWSKRLFLELAPVTVVAAYLAGLFWLKPHVEESNPVLVHLKGEKPQRVQGKIVYVLDKFVIVSTMPGSGGQPYLSAVNSSEISQIEHLPFPKPTPTPTLPAKNLEPKAGPSAKT
jgi:hypothetical protein